jgi:hypothetical protein
MRESRNQTSKLTLRVSSELGMVRIKYETQVNGTQELKKKKKNNTQNIHICMYKAIKAPLTNNIEPFTHTGITRYEQSNVHNDISTQSYVYITTALICLQQHKLSFTFYVHNDIFFHSFSLNTVTHKRLSFHAY